MPFSVIKERYTVLHFILATTVEKESGAEIKKKPICLLTLLRAM